MELIVVATLLFHIFRLYRMLMELTLLHPGRRTLISGREIDCATQEMPSVSYPRQKAQREILQPR